MPAFGARNIETPDRTPTADIRVRVDPPNGATLVEGEEAYTIVIGNGGPARADRVQVTLAPNNIVMLRSPRSACAAFPCTIDRIAPGDNESIFVHLRPAGPGAYGFTASARALEHDPDPANNRASVSKIAPSSDGRKKPVGDQNPIVEPPIVNPPIVNPPIVNPPAATNGNEQPNGDDLNSTDGIHSPAPPPSVPARVWRWLHRHPVWPVSGSLVLFALVILATTIIGRWRRAYWLARLTVTPLPSAAIEGGPASLPMAAPALRITASCATPGDCPLGHVPIIKEVRTR